MTKSSEKPRRETNPVYWLEIRQSRRNFFFYVILGFGLLAILPFFFLHHFFSVVDEPENFNWFTSGGAALLLFYWAGPSLIPSYLVQKLLSQLNEEDLLLQTPLRSPEILVGKLQVAITLIVCLYGPSLPFAVWQIAWSGAESFLANIACSTVTFCLSMIALGFLSGAKTPLLKGLSLFLFVIFGVANSILIGGIVISYIALDLYTSAEFGLLFLGVCQALAIFVIASCSVFWIGVATLHRNRNLGHVLGIACACVALLSAFPLTVMFAMEPPLIFVGFWLVFFAAYFGAPLGILFMAMRHNDSQKTIPVVIRDDPRSTAQCPESCV